VKRHVDFLSTLYVTWGAIFALVTVAGFALAGGAFAIAESTGPVRFGSEMAARLTGVTIMVIALIALVWAILHLAVGRQLKKLRSSARLLAIGLAVGNMILFPFGTALGAYAVWVLLNEEGRKLFEPA
jgi:cytochrome bd-type quinol oxidase subunit 2